VERLQLALDAGEILLAGPVSFGPDVTHGFPDMSFGVFVSFKRIPHGYAG